MEDTVCMEQDIKPGVSVFAVFDGHGGREISKFSSEHFVEFLKETEGFKIGKYDLALQQTYKKIEDAIYGGKYDD